MTTLLEPVREHVDDTCVPSVAPATDRAFRPKGEQPKSVRMAFVVVWIGPVRYVVLETPRGLAFVRGARK